MGKSRMMGAGSACSTLYGSNVNLKTCGGSKKQGLPFSINTRVQDNRHVKINSVGNKRDVIFSRNQLGGVSSSAFSSSSHRYAVGGGAKYMMPFICDPYCNTRKINRAYNPTAIPDNINSTIQADIRGVFSYLNYKNRIYCFTDISKLNLNFTNSTINGQTIREYLVIKYPTLNIDKAITELQDKFLSILKSEDIIYGDQSIMERDSVLTQHLYSTPSMRNFPTKNKQSISSQLFEALSNNYPDKITNCPIVKPLMTVGDEIIFTGNFTYNDTVHAINFNIIAV
jgi:hypothetical protein